jgi:hypothetical protein
MTLAIERRSSPRMTPGALGTDLLIMDANERRMIPATLLNISAGGGLIRSDRAIVRGGQLSLLINSIPAAGWIDVEVVRSGGPSEVGVRFVSPFSPGFVLAAASERQARQDKDAASETPYLGDAIPIW